MVKPLWVVVTIAALSTAGPALSRTHRHPRHARARTMVVSTGSEQGLRLGGTTISRPFGAQLVDRLAVTGTFATPDAALYLVRGDTGGDCPSRFVVVAVRAGQAPAATDAFGTCNAVARGRVSGGVLTVTMPATAIGGPPVRFVYDGGTMRLVDAVPATATADEPSAPPGYAAPTAVACPTPGSADAGTQATAVADFERSYPADYRNRKALEKIELSPDQVRDLVAGLACVSTLPGAERVVPEAATPLFVSRRHGAAAFAALEKLARDPGSNANLRAAVRGFSAEMRFRAADHERF